MKNMLIIIIILTSVFLILCPIYALEMKPLALVNADEFISNIQVSAPCDDDHFNIIWWIPFEYWQCLYENDDSTSIADKEMILNSFKPYSIIGVCQADVSVFGAFNFYEIDEVGEMLEVIYKAESGIRYRIRLAKDIDPNVNMLLDIFTPIFRAAMGNMGENFHFFVLTDYDSKDTRMINPYYYGTLYIHLGTRKSKLIEAQLALPVNALYVPRICPNGKEAHVTWKYCPWSGQRLPD